MSAFGVRVATQGGQYQQVTNLHDTVNSKIVVACYHQKPWYRGSVATSATFTSMKYQQESAQYEAAPESVELGRIVRLVKSKVTKFRDNPIQTLVAYENNNMGRTKQGVENLPLFKLVFRDRQIDLKEIYLADPYWVEFINQIIQQIEIEVSR